MMNLGVIGNHDKITFGGTLVRELIETGKYAIINNSDKVSGGPFTRYDPGDTNDITKKSVLDIAIVSIELLSFVKEFLIDDKAKYSMERPVNINGKFNLRKSDHYTILMKFENIPKKTKE